MAGGEASAQERDNPRFDVASIKPSAPKAGRAAPGRIVGGPGTRDPGRFVTENFSLYYLLSSAYDLKRYQIVAPDWTESALFDVTAKVPEGASKAQFRVMLQSMLEERFHLRAHWEKRDITAYKLVVKSSGAKWRLAPGAQGGESKRLLMEGLSKADESPSGQPEYSGSAVTMVNGNYHLQVTDETLDQFSTRLANEIRLPVSNETGLAGEYKIGLTWARRETTIQHGDAASNDGALGGESRPDIFTALQEQLGLKLVQGKAPGDVLVVDKIDKMPTAN